MNSINTNRNFGLDAVRAFSILLVVYSHMFRSLAFQCGLFGVEIFFVLSGFLIGNIIYKSFGLKSNLEGKDLFDFWKRRWWRTLPLYYLIIVLKFIYNHSVGFKFLHFVFFIQNYFDDKFFAVSWSLAVEEWFYLLVPFLIFIFYKSNLNKEKIVWYLLSFIVLGIILKLIFEVPFHLLRINIPLRMDSLCIGVLLAFIKNLKPVMYARLKNPVCAGMSILLAALLIYCLKGFIAGESLVGANNLVRTMWFPVCSLAIALTFPFMESNKFINTFLAGKKWILVPVTLTSLLAYSIYLVHTIVLTFMGKHLAGIPFLKIISLIIIYVISYLLYRFFEKPTTAMREK